MTNTVIKCKLKDCDNNSFTSGYCKRHYASFRYYKTKYNKESLEYCKVKNCFSFSINDDYCFYHNKMFINHNLEKTYNPKDFNIKCKLKDCNERYYAKGYCENHYRKLYIEYEKDNNENLINKEVDCTLQNSIENNV